jgi:hypothetical protein
MVVEKAVIDPSKEEQAKLGLRHHVADMIRNVNGMRAHQLNPQLETWIETGESTCRWYIDHREVYAWACKLLGLT